MDNLSLIVRLNDFLLFIPSDNRECIEAVKRLDPQDPSFDWIQWRNEMKHWNVKIYFVIESQFFNNEEMNTKSIESSFLYFNLLLNECLGLSSTILFDAILWANIQSAEEAIGAIKSCQQQNLSCSLVLSCRQKNKDQLVLPSGELIQAFITECDLVTNNYCAKFYINSEDPVLSYEFLQSCKIPWIDRVGGVLEFHSNQGVQILRHLKHHDLMDLYFEDFT